MSEERLKRLIIGTLEYLTQQIKEWGLEGQVAESFRAIDWKKYPGAQSWPNGDEPIVRHVQHGDLIADARGVAFLGYLRMKDGGRLPVRDCTLSLTFTVVDYAHQFLNSLPHDFDPRQWGLEFYRGELHLSSKKDNTPSTERSA